MTGLSTSAARRSTIAAAAALAAGSVTWAAFPLTGGAPERSPS